MLRQIMPSFAQIVIGLLLLSGEVSGQSITFSYDNNGNRIEQIQDITNPAIIIQGDTTGCVSDSLALTASGGVSYIWSTGDTDSSISISLVDTLAIKVIATAPNGCIDSLETTLIAYPIPGGYGLIGDSIPIADSMSLTPYSAPLQAGSFYDWSVEGGFLASGYGTPEVEVVWTTDSVGNIRLVETSQYGCVSDTISRLVQAGAQQYEALDWGWNLFSTFIDPSDSHPASVFTSVSGQLEQVKNIQSFYDPLNPLSPLQNISDGQGYWVRVDAADTFYLRGLWLRPEQTTLSLSPGWNLVGYVPRLGQAPENALIDIIPHVVQVKSEMEVYDPTVPPILNTLVSMEPGKGYWVLIDSAAPNPLEFTYPDPAANKSGREAVVFDVPNGWEAPVLPNSTVAFGEVTLNGEALPGEGVIGVFAGTEPRGASKVIRHNGKTLISLVIQSEVSETLSFKLSYEGQIYESAFITQSKPGSTLPSYLPLSFGKVATNVLNGVSSQFSLHPNPTSDAVTLSWNLRAPSDLQIRLVSLEGKVLHTVFDSSVPSTSNSFTWTPQLPKGMYWVEAIHSHGQREYLKLLIQ